MIKTFKSLRIYNYRVWASGAIVSNIGTWMQRTAQDWLVLTQLTHNNATAVGIVMSLQFGPQALLLPFTGFAADHFDRRRLVFVTQSAMGACALGLGLLTVLNLVQLWHVYVFAFLLGCATAFDSPARQTFVAELVDEENLSNAVGLNSTSFNTARMIGPAVAGLMIAGVGTGWVFLINAASFVAVLCSLCLLRTSELHPSKRAAKARGSLVDGFRYVWHRPDLLAVMWMVFFVGTFGLNFPIFISTMAVREFHVGASHFGFLTSTMAIGSVAGALLAAGRTKPRLGVLLLASLVFGVAFIAAALTPNYWLFGVTLMALGISAQSLTTTSNSTIQLSTDPVMRGRVLAIYLALALGTTPLGAPLVGWVADRFGPRFALLIGAGAGLAAFAVGVRYLINHRDLRIRFAAGRLSFSLSKEEAALEKV